MMAHPEGNSQHERTLTVLGCGTLGKAILRGILTAPADSRKSVPTKVPSRYVACVKRAESAKTLQEELGPLTEHLTVLQDENLRGVQQADIVILACKPQMVRTVLGEDGIRDALKGKLLLSILAGVTGAAIDDFLYGSGDGAAVPEDERCKVVRVMPNTASGIGESMTVISTPDRLLSTEQTELVSWMFGQIGSVVKMPPHLMDVSTALCGSGPAFYALMLEAMADGGVAMGIPRKEALVMAAQTMKGTAGMVLNGEHPALLRDKVSTPGGCTIGGLLVLEEGRVRGNVARAVREATVVASMLGKGTQGVNGTRFNGNGNGH